MSAWTHLICPNCWNAERPEKTVDPTDSRYHQQPEEPCCFCTQPTGSGIYYRANPATTKCKGEGPVHAESIVGSRPAADSALVAVKLETEMVMEVPLGYGGTDGAADFAAQLLRHVLEELEDTDTPIKLKTYTLRKLGQKEVGG